MLRRAVIAQIARRVALAVVFGTLASATTAPANEAPAINAQSFELAPGLGDGLLTRTARRQDTGDWDRSWNLLGGLHYTRRALAFVNKQGAEPLVQTVLGDVWMMDVGGSVGFGTWTFEAVMPVALLIRGGGPDLMQVGEARSPSFGDLRLGARRWLFGRSVGGIGRIDAAAMLGYGAATAATGSWLGSGGKQLDATLLLTLGRGVWRAHANLGARLRGRSALVVKLTDPATGLVKTDASGAAQTNEALVTGSLLRAQLAVGRTFGSQNRAFGNLGMQALVPVGDVTAGQQLLELYLDGGYTLDDRAAFRVFGGLSTALSAGYGSAQARAIVGLRFVPANLPSDSDGDGLDDRDDACPKRAEDHDGFEDNDGCPEEDNDGDGIKDAADKCPLRAEDADKFEDADGCPEDDNDGDGIKDGDDKCPNAAEDHDKFDDADGCPDDDNDGDGLPDKDDLCPNRPENKNGTQDRDGCPDARSGETAVLNGDRINLSRRVRFGFRSAVLRPDGKRVLDAAAALIGKNKRILALQVRAHTDDNGLAAELQMLSKQRSIAVRDYLDGKRVLPAGKIIAMGLGSDQPLTTNLTLAGRSKNRRVELIITGWAKPAPKAQPAKKKTPTPAKPAPKPTTTGSTTAPAPPPAVSSGKTTK